MLNERRNLLTAEQFAEVILNHLTSSQGKDPEHASIYDWRMALSLALRDQVIRPWFASTRTTYEAEAKRVYYLSMEFLVGRLIEDVATNLRAEDVAAAAMRSLGQDYGQVVRDEPDAALGNGGLGRLAACFMDSLATLGIPAYGYGIRYEHGLFEQHFKDGQQIETAENWLTQRYAWEFERPEVRYEIGFGGTVEKSGQTSKWIPAETIIASAYDTPVVGWNGLWANTLRLWAAKPVKVFDLDSFNRGEYLAASELEALARTISRVLYPDDTSEAGKELRLKQEYFFTAASIKDILRRLDSEGRVVRDLPQRVAIQLNDTHPAIAGPELVRLLVDERKLEMENAIDIARGCLGYTNHTLLPEALERWPEPIFKRVLPRHLEIVREIESAHLKASGSPVRILEDGDVKMGELSFIMAHKVNGVSALHSDLVRETVFEQLNRDYPDRILNQTNGITPRRWLHNCNPDLRILINDTIGTGWPADLEQLEKLVPHAQDAGFLEAFKAVKAKNKVRVANWLKSHHYIAVDPDAMFDAQIKRIHEYKRQLMNLLETVALWNEIRDNPNADWVPRVKIFGGKAAPGYVVAKQIIHLINDVAAVINADPQVKGLLKIVYPENYNVSMAELLIPATNLSEQISTAGNEASGTGNMKFALNGAPTIGTLDGANVEIRERVGAENFFLFGLTAAEVVERRKQQNYSAAAIAVSQRLSRALEQIENGVFSPGDPDRYQGLVQDLRQKDYFLVTCDFDDYFAAQRRVDSAYADQDSWTRMAVLNTARVGWFSSDRTIADYAKDIWNAHSLIGGARQPKGEVPR
ncbi:glycogen/starch/alpha-glucan family phosphorylase [Stappia sp. GBMRC 2046]|uniref:Alpha-1,4 glucan phosphorylase n=1 Tax=Stappia sediminis TaxID=2692190 RepID=A0A7X3LUM9_9HYPH|nr:glycogen/starch/alpha-glucan phosphorylase [Stappia sediminis]MXN65427.1 glycogen/starch/alpha-glucan family phosphorylase [Stappia sediminis]